MEPVNDNKLDQIYEWLDQITFSRPKKNISRDFSDGVFMAELLKRYYPKYVDLHNYVPGNSIAKKIDNWNILNRKILSKIDMKLGKDVINQLANSQSGIIEKVLTDVRAKILKDCNADQDSLYFDYEENGRIADVKPILNPEEVANRTVPRHIFIRLKQELQERNETINALHQKISHLESLIKLKDQRIVDLTTQVKRPMVDASTPRINVPNYEITKVRMNS